MDFEFDFLNIDNIYNSFESKEPRNVHLIGKIVTPSRCFQSVFSETTVLLDYTVCKKVPWDTIYVHLYGEYCDNCITVLFYDELDSERVAKQYHKLLDYIHTQVLPRKPGFYEVPPEFYEILSKKETPKANTYCGRKIAPGPSSLSGKIMTPAPAPGLFGKKMEPGPSGLPGKKMASGPGLPGKRTEKTELDLFMEEDDSIFEQLELKKEKTEMELFMEEDDAIFSQLPV